MEGMTVSRVLMNAAVVAKTALFAPLALTVIPKIVVFNANAFKDIIYHQ
jgi:hypothetical protein